MDEQLRSREQIAKLLKENLNATRQRMKRQADLHCTERSFEIGDWVYLRLRPYRQNSVAIGAYQVLQRIGQVGYKLELPPRSKIHPVFHVSQLKKKLGQQVSSQTTLPHVTEEGIIQAIPEAILVRRLVKGRNKAEAEILVQWLGASEEDATWENYKHFQARFPDVNLEDKVALRGNQ